MSDGRIRYVDSHTEGEPTRVVFDGGPCPAGATVAEMAEDLHARHGWFRPAVVCEPRGSDVLVGALLVPTPDASCAAGVIFFNNAGNLGMCGHGTIGVVRTLAHLGRLGTGDEVRLDTPVGVVRATLCPPDARGDRAVEVANVRSFVHRRDVRLDLGGGRSVTGDIAWGGNGFFLCEDHGLALDLANAGPLTDLCRRIRSALERSGLGEVAGRPVDHVELLGPPRDPRNHARNFVLCSGDAYDRSPCGTGTSAKLACLAERGTLAPGEAWRQESVLGTVFEARYLPAPGGGVLPSVRGRAWIVAEGSVVLEESDPFRHGIVAAAR